MPSTITTLDDTHGRAPGPDTALPSPPEPAPGLRLKLTAMDWLVLPLAYALAIFFTWPLLPQSATAIMGDGKDDWLEAWNLWWFNRALNTGTSPYHFTSLFAPQGATDYLHMLNPLGGLLTLPVQWLAGVPLAHNIACWSALALSAFGGYLLCRDISGSRPAALLGGFIFGFAPHQFAQLLGHLSVASAQFLALGIWCLYRAARLDGRRALVWTLWSSVCLVLSLLSHFYVWLFHLGTMFALAVLLSLFSTSRGRYRWAPLGRGLLAIGVSVVVCAPLLIATISEARGPDAAGQQESTAAERAAYSADLLAYFIPNPFHPVWGESARNALRPLTGTLIEKVVFPGYLAVALAITGIVFRRTRRRCMPWAILAAAGLLLSLGPTLHLGGSDTGLPLPAQLFYALPFSSLLRVPARFDLVFTLGLSVCAALGLATLTEMRPLAARSPAPAAAAIALLLLELLPAPFPTASWNVDPWYTSASRDPSGAVLEVPFDQYDTRPQASQIASGLPVVGGYLSRMPVYALDRGVPPFAQLGLDHVPGQPLPGRDEPSLCRGSSTTAQEDMGILRLAGVRYLALHTGRLKPDDPRIALVQRLFPAGPSFENESLRVFDAGQADAPAGLAGAVEDSVDWGPVEQDSYRWTGQNTARIHAWSGAPRSVRVELNLHSFGEPRSVQISSGNRTLASGRVESTGSVFAFDWTLPRGFSTLRISGGGRAHTPASLGMGDDERALTFSLNGCAFAWH